MVKEIWQVYKFGGSSLADGQCLLTVNHIIHQNESSNLVVVVSAMAGFTDALFDVIRSKEWSEFSPCLKLYKKIIKAVIKNSEISNRLEELLTQDIKTINTILDSGKSEQLSDTETSIILGFGEIWSARLLVEILKENSSKDPLLRDVHHLDARNIIHVKHGEMGLIMNWEQSQLGLKKEKNNNSGILVMSGFLATDLDNNPSILGRNGSDFSASIMASLVEAKSVTIWTDVDGVMTGDPNQVLGAKIITEMSYDEAAELAYFGAKVIHPKTMSPLVQKNIPICIRNTFNGNSPGTKISSQTNITKAVKGITTIDNVALVNLEGPGMIGIPGTANRLYSCLQTAGVSIILITQASSEHSICFAVKSELVKLVEKEIKKEFAQEFDSGDLQDLQIQSNCNIIAVVGSGMSGTKGIAAQFFKAISEAGVNVKAIAQGSSEKNISAVVSQCNAARALKSIHSSFFDESIELILGIVGFGNVARELFHQLQTQSKTLEADSDIRLKVVALANSRNMVLKDSAIQESEIHRLNQDQNSENKSDLSKILEHLVATPGSIKVMIDCTASKEVPVMYKSFFNAGIHVIAANKKGVSGSIELYEEIMQHSKSNKTSFYYETTAGAGLPFVKSLQDLILTGDKVNEIEGIFSGTLSYLFNTYNGSVPFSKIISKARDMGFTEPDPREDLSGMDVARKLVILAREMNLKITTDDVEVENLVHQNLENLGVDEYLERLKDYDAEMMEKLNQARNNNKVLRYIARLNSNGNASVKLEEVDSNHLFAQLSGSENIIAFKTERYFDSPLVLKGPGAGPSVTAAGIFADLLMVSTQSDRFTRLNSE